MTTIKSLQSWTLLYLEVAYKTPSVILHRLLGHIPQMPQNETSYNGIINSSEQVHQVIRISSYLSLNRVQCWATISCWWMVTPITIWCFNATVCKNQKHSFLFALYIFWVVHFSLYHAAMIAPLFKQIIEVDGENTVNWLEWMTKL